MAPQRDDPMDAASRSLICDHCARAKKSPSLELPPIILGADRVAPATIGANAAFPYIQIHHPLGIGWVVLGDFIGQRP